MKTLEQIIEKANKTEKEIGLIVKCEDISKLNAMNIEKLKGQIEGLIFVSGLNKMEWIRAVNDWKRFTQENLR